MIGGAHGAPHQTDYNKVAAEEESIVWQKARGLIVCFTTNPLNQNKYS